MLLQLGFYATPHSTVFWRGIGRTMKTLAYWVQNNILQVSRGVHAKDKDAVDAPELGKTERRGLAEQKKVCMESGER